jgi:hypothetical protein
MAQHSFGFLLEGPGGGSQYTVPLVAVKRRLTGVRIMSGAAAGFICGHWSSSQLSRPKATEQRERTGIGELGFSIGFVKAC